MKIEGVTINCMGEAGNVVVVAFRWGCNEQFDMNDVGGVLAWLRLHGLCGDGCMARQELQVTKAEAEHIRGRIAEIQAEDDATVAGSGVLGAEDKAHGEAFFTAAATAETQTTRRRKPNPLGVADAGAAPLPSTGEPSTAASPSTPEPTSRRRRAPADAGPAATPTSPDATPTSPAPSEAEAAPLRRRRAAPAAEGTPATTAPTEAPAASPEPSTRRRRAAPSAASTVEPEVAPEAPAKETAPTPPASAPAVPSISDVDLTKAASRGAAALTPNVVKAFIATFLNDDQLPCTSVNQIHVLDRRDFLDELQAKIEAAQ